MQHPLYSGQDIEKWELWEYRKTVNLEIVYDYAYENRYPDAKQRIENNIRILRERFVKEVGVLILASTPTKIFSYADSCSTDPYYECEHGSDSECRNSNPGEELQSLHHTNIYNNLLRIPFPDVSQTAKLFFTGHECCEYNSKDGTHTKCHTGNYSKNGIAYSDFGIAVIMNFDSPEAEQKTTLHEFCHLFGAPDHAGGIYMHDSESISDMTGIPGFNQKCVLGEDKETAYVQNELPICDGCKTMMIRHLNQYDYGSK